MKKLTVAFLISVLSVACSGQNKNVLSAREFADKHETDQSIPVIDVRTPAEFEKGNIGGSVNVNWNDPSFEKTIATYNMSKPVMVYCLAGSRSADAAKRMREMGFKQVIELDGGILKWRAANLPERMPVAHPENAISKEKYAEMLTDQRTVLVDFYAQWCMPCKKLKPSLDEIAEERKESVKVIRIDLDENPQLAKELGVSALPALFIYKAGEMKWSTTGFKTKEELLSELSKY